MIEAAEAVAKLCPGTRAEFDSDFRTQLAMMKLAEDLGEAANHVALDVQEAHPDVPWRAIIGTRHRLSHGYFEIDLDILWEVITNDIPAVLPEIRKILSTLDEREL